MQSPDEKVDMKRGHIYTHIHKHMDIATTRPNRTVGRFGEEEKNIWLSKCTVILLNKLYPHLIFLWILICSI